MRLFVARTARRPRSRARARPGRREAVAVSLLLLLAVFVGVGLIGSVVHSAQEARLAGATAAKHAPSYTDLATSLPVVALIGEGGLRVPSPVKGVSSVPWQERTASDLRLRLDDAGRDAAGFTSSGTAMFSERAKHVAADAAVIIFFAGPADRGASSIRLLKASTAAIAVAREQAPHARVLVIGPPLVTSKASSALQRERRALEKSASITGAVFADPVGGRWLSKPGLLDAAGRPTDAGERALAARIQVALAPLL